MGIFSKPPKSFNLDRKSPFAADLKSAISVQLSLSLGPVFADYVLAEYVTVLVCNGKTQNQARDDLDAFLGDRSEAFVTWLWDFLLKKERQCTVDATLKDKDDILTCPEDSERRRNALEVNNKKSGPAVTLIQIRDHQKTQNSALPKVINSSPEGGLISGATSPLSENAQNRRISGIFKRHPSPTDLGSLYCDKVQVSVWDRLSKPHKAALTDDVHADNASKHREVRREVVHRLSRPNKAVLTDDAHEDDAKKHREVHREVAHQCMRNQSRVRAHARAHAHAPSFKHNRMHNSHSNLHGNRFASGNWRKRDFFQITQSDSSLVRGRRADNFYNNQWRPDKRSKFVAKAPEDLLSTVEAVKLRLHLMEREIYQLRSRNIGMGNDQKNNSSINSGVTESTVEDHESRTVLVSNVHYAAKSEALCSYFAKCGQVVNVVLLSDLSFAPDSFVRSAYITFANMESIDKALSLSGATFYSRVLKVVKYNQKDTLPAVSTSPAVSYTKRPVQQPAASEQSVPERSLISSIKDVSGNSNIHNAVSIAEKTDEAAGFSASGSGDQKPCLISPIKDIAESSHMHIVVESAEKTNMEAAEFLASGDKLSLISPMKDVAGCTDIRNAEESVADKKINTSSGDEEHSLISPVKDISGFTYMRNAGSVAEEINTEAEVLTCGDEQPSSIPDVKDVSENIIGVDSTTSVACVIEEQLCSDSCESGKIDEVLPCKV